LTNTLQVVEILNSGIHWMEPRDLHVTQMAPMINAAGMGFSSPHEGGANGLLADGAVRFVSEKTPAETVRKLIERDDGEAVGEF
jgi:prepilin-type processing-associated H-X9-DG protein